MPEKVIKRGLEGNSHVELTRPLREELAAILAPTLKRLTLDEFVSCFTSPMHATLEYFELLNGNRGGETISLLFNPHRLATKTKTARTSLFGALKEPNFASGVARSYLAQKGRMKHASLFNMLTVALRIGVNGIQWVDEFPPHVARDICAQFGVDLESRVLDPCAGWGGRMIGISTICNTYVGFEPASETASGLRKLAKWLSHFRPDYRTKIFELPFEDSELPDEWFDFAITSPPYYDTEEYSDEPTNSLNRYLTFVEWVDGFYYPFLEKTLAALKPGGVFVLNVGNRKYKLSSVMHEWAARKGYQVDRLDQYLSGKGGLGRSYDGEAFYAIRKP